MIADRLRDLRHARGLTQQQAAELAGMSKMGFCFLEQGRRLQPGADTVVKLCRAFGVSADELLGFKKGGRKRMDPESEPEMTINWQKAEALLRHLAEVSEEFECEAQALLPYGQQRIAVRVEVLPPETVQETPIDP